VARIGSRAALFGLLVAICAGLGGCSLFFGQSVKLPPVSTETVEYYPRQVKGYQGSYPPRRILILPTVDAREFKDSSAIDHAPGADGNPQIGVVLDHNRVIQRVYGPAIGPLAQQALAASAEEAGLLPALSGDSLEAVLRKTNVQYALTSKLVRCWVKKERGTDTRLGPTWATSAEFRVEVAIYKPPFHTPFWQGASVATYDDPPLTNFAAGPENDTSIYDEPGQVLSVALTRAIAGVFRRSDLHSLIVEDIVMPR